MSLFGGDGVVPEIQPSQQSELLPKQTNARQPTTPPAGDTQKKQNAQLVSFTLDSDEEDELEDDGGSELEPAEGVSRPNRFKGKAPTWKGYTAADRQIAASLDQIISGNLTVHAYNAHALKRRVRLPTEQLTGLKTLHSKDLWLKRGGDLEFTDVQGELQTELVPSKLWTAWPLPPEKLSPTSRGMSDGEEDGWMIRSGGQAEDAGSVLRDELLAVFLQLAKDKWRSREPETDASDTAVKGSRKLGSRSKSVQSGRTDTEPPSSDAEMGDDRLLESTKDSPSRSDSEAKWADIIGKKRRGTVQQEPSKPVIMADDDKARRLLGPSINSLLSNLDDIALAIRRSRLNHFGRGAYSDTSGSEFTSDADSASSESGSRGRSRSKSTTKRPSVRVLARSSAPATARSTKEEMSKQSLPHDSDSASDYAAEFEGRLSRNESEPLASPSIHPHSAHNRSKSRSMPADQTPSTTQAGLLDWSEVLGLAALRGWNVRALSRTAQRCSALFGETMQFRALDENHAAASSSTLTSYPLTPIPANLDNVLLESTISATAKRPLFEAGTLRCPHADCWGHEQEFKIPYRVIEHVRRVHGYDPRDNDSDNEERKVGGVHKDGFLQPITAKQGWLGGGRAKSGEKRRVKRQKRASEGGGDGEEYGE